MVITEIKENKKQYLSLLPRILRQFQNIKVKDMQKS